ncbi:MAG: methylenetetrahydrofolate reductase [NAD(P)H] [Oscillospiraceae bacterium]|nr:methylenetetrahydrofolate reductase [NAD(P)H] [Oscillospiraceae bacterium]
MKISEYFKKDRCVFSFEVFPPKKDASAETIYSTLNSLKSLSPDFISVTYGAGGSAADNITGEIASYISSGLGICSAAHLTCVSNSKEDIDIILDDLKNKGVENILALRGDINPDRPAKNDFKYASDLIRYIKEKGDFHISAACYPETHLDSPDMITDIRHLKEKQDAGAEHMISQLFFDNELFYSFLEKARIAGITVPIEAGIMPVTNKKSIERMVSMCGASLPAKFTRMMAKYENNPEALRDAGIAYAVDQIVDLVAYGVDGVHLYTMNNPYIAEKIASTVSGIL